MKQVKFWHCEDDGTVSIEVTRQFVDAIVARGGNAHLHTFPQGGHEPQLVGPPVAHPSGNTRFEGTTLEINPAVEGVFAWIKQFD